MSKGGRPRSAGEIVASHPRENLVDALLENLSRALTPPRNLATPVQVCLVRQFDDGYEQRIAIWPRAKRQSPEADEQVDLEVAGFGVLRIFTTAVKSAKNVRLVDESIAWLRAIMRAVPPRRRWEKARHDAQRAQADVEVFEVRIARARESERIRLVETMTTATVRDLDSVRTMLTEPASDVAWPSVSAAMGSLIHDFRTTVRGVFPAMLPERGAVDTLREIAATLPIPVDFRGDLGRRPRWEVESNFTHAVADVLGAVVALRQPIQVVFERDGALRARLRNSETGGDLDRLAEALTANRERLEALGGALTISRSGSTGLEVSVTVPDRSEVSWLPLSKRQLTSRPVHARVAALLESSRLPEEKIAPWRTELFAPVRLLVLQQPLPASLPGVQAVMCESDPDRTLCEQLYDQNGPWGRIDAITCAADPGEEFARELRQGPLLFSPGIDANGAASMLTARAPVFAARRALARISDYVRRRPQAEWLRWQVDHLTHGSHELVEDSLLNDLARGTAPSIVDGEGARLIGMHGGDKRERLGIADDASFASVEAATDARLERWTSIVALPGLDQRSREAAEVVLGSATRLLMA
ncbi:MAG TPA: hypothetical protein DIW46_11720 [Microbacterium sp.]|nr:hypothetical protein [Microbacterium sp.]